VTHNYAVALKKNFIHAVVVVVDILKSQKHIPSLMKTDNDEFISQPSVHINV
jgi:hypothetical protein